ncbi:hypothetical protein FIBSPDRAFT_898039 [Athelia psychrophila]|uniref:Uncharacterized protein n=1 Tax=Athelia psychrophila TaxID=1759441 RepID=A0A166BI44_9AGAM|nr:hypothetical protein FIBSPDRAFT_898039 [Fibularhizoctonia sp. CBS 109695]
MAKTGCSARKSTGGNAPRRELGRRGVGAARQQDLAIVANAAGSAREDAVGSAREDAVGSAREDTVGSAREDAAGSAREDAAGSAREDAPAHTSLSPEPQDPDSHELIAPYQTYCHVCCDGNEQLVLCDLCTRVICRRHLGTLPADFDLSLYDFVCTTCHEVHLGKIPYRAFYISVSNSEDPHAWVPVLYRPIALSAEFTLSRNSHVSNASTLILHFCLDGLQSQSLPPYLLELVLKEYLDPAQLKLIEQAYDFTDGIDEHEASVNEWVQTIPSYHRVIIFVTTHAHDTSGDLYSTPAFSSDPYQVLKALFPSSLRHALKGRKVFLNFLVCGGFADTPSSRIVMFKAARKVHAKEVIAFSSAGLIPTLTNTFWLDFASRVLLEGFGLRQALPYMLSATSTSCFVRHTNLVYAQVPRDKSKPVVCAEYIWTHPVLRPFGRRLPANCVECGCMSSFGKPIKLTPKTAATTYVFVCQGRDTEGKACLHELSIEPIEGFEPYGQSPLWFHSVPVHVVGDTSLSDTEACTNHSS